MRARHSPQLLIGTDEVVLKFNSTNDPKITIPFTTETANDLQMLA